MGAVIENYDTIVNEVTSRFIVTEHFYSAEVAIFFVDESTPDIKGKFRELAESLKQLSLIPTLRKEGDRLVLRVLQFSQREFKKSHLPLILLLITVSTVFADGLIRSSDKLMAEYFYPGIPPALNALMFTIAVLGIVVSHELGHLVSMITKGHRPSLPYLIPGIPGAIPTFGAVIVQRDIPVNRDDLFDIGVAGPLTGFIVTLLVLVAFLANPPILTEAELKVLEQKYGVEIGGIPPPLIFVLLMNVLSPAQPGEYVFINPLGWAALLGLIITFLNTLPAWQLDGGHMARAVLGRKGHAIATVASVIVMMLLGYYLMAFLVLFLSSFGPPAAMPLDDYSPVSLTKKAAFVLMLVICVLSAMLPTLG